MSATNGSEAATPPVAAVAPPPAAAAAPPPASASGAPPTTGPHAESEKKILENLKKVYDPEIPMNIVDLGLIYGFDWHDDKLTLRMTLTAPGCPVAGILAEEVKAAAEKVPEVKEATVDMVWEPAWTPDRMSEFAKRQFGYL
ncbi:MAG: iron-sulfur cluster assembly protein [Thermoplasmata archaeon]|nr:iron-sulfur cluster assembly protein [Thermoplasmata archaeon]MCI4344842.1 iron-sulfur cluster assembly protein [Thermoplasmata archaeon]